jgi:pyrroline-5-carboxylate reductase
VKSLGALWLLGCGNMGGALLDRWLAAGYPAGDVTVIDPASAQRAGVRHLDAVPTDGAPAILVLGVKPQMLAEAVRPLAGRVPPGTVVVSMLAGTRTDTLRALFSGCPVLRTMPNTPARVGQGITALFGDDDAMPVGAALFGAVGRIVRLESEDRFDSVTAVSGSGPAYVFAFVEALRAGGVAAGLSTQEAESLARGTVIGAAALLAADATPAGELRRQVTSPNGVTAEGLRALNGVGELDALLTATVAAAAARSAEMSA